MLLILGIILLVLWLAGVIAFHVTAWFVHIVLVIALIALILHFARGRSAA
jgi:hypothetical protein